MSCLAIPGLLLGVVLGGPCLGVLLGLSWLFCWSECQNLAIPAWAVAWSVAWCDSGAVAGCSSRVVSASGCVALIVLAILSVRMLAFCRDMVLCEECCATCTRHSSTTTGHQMFCHTSECSKEQGCHFIETQSGSGILWDN